VALVSSLYRLIVPPARHESPWVRRLRLQRQLRRIIHEIGYESVQTQIAAAVVPAEYVKTKAELMELVWLLDPSGSRVMPRR
jgi:hypothetical protein